MKIFMAMPFKPEFFNLFEYGYLPVCRDLGLEIETVLDDLAPGPIPAKILAKIQASDIVLVDVSELNANVYFEAGYATGIGKPILYAVQDVGSIPFDTQQDLHLIHEGRISVIRRELPRYLASAIESGRGENVLGNPSLRVGRDGWSVRSSGRPKQRCLIRPEPEVETSGGMIALRVRRAALEGTPLSRGVSVIEFSSYTLKEASGELVPLEGRQRFEACCHAFVRNEVALQHRWRVKFYRRPGEFLSEVDGSFSRVPGGTSWRLVEERFAVPIPPGATGARLALDARGGRAAATYWVSRPFVAITPQA